MKKKIFIILLLILAAIGIATSEASENKPWRDLPFPTVVAQHMDIEDIRLYRDDDGLEILSCDLRGGDSMIITYAKGKGRGVEYTDIFLEILYKDGEGKFYKSRSFLFVELRDRNSISYIQEELDKQLLYTRISEDDPDFYATMVNYFHSIDYIIAKRIRENTDDPAVLSFLDK